MAELDDKMDGDLRARVVQLEQASASSRLTALEAWRQQSAVTEARHEEQWGTLVRSVDDIKATLSWIVRLVIGAIVLAAVAFMVRGGLSIPPL